MRRRGLHRPDGTGLPALIAAAAVVVLAAGCAGGGTPPSEPTHRAAGRPAPSFVGARQAAARYLRRRESHLPVARMRVHVSRLRTSGRSETVLATAAARLGRPPGSAWVGLGQRVLVIRHRSGRLVVAEDVTRHGGYSVVRGGVAAMPRTSRFRIGRRVVVVSAPGVPAAEAAEVVRVADAVLPRLLARYRRPGTRTRAPVIFMTESWASAERVAGVPMPHEAIGAEYRGLVYLKVPAWQGVDAIERDALLVHELTHVASAALVIGGPLSLVEGVARYEEQQYAIAAGAAWPYRYLADAYRRGYPSRERWRWTFNHWQLHRRLPIWLAYEDGAAVVRAVLDKSGAPGLRRLAGSFRRDGETGRFTDAQLDRAFRAATGRPFAAVVAQAQAETLAAAG